MSDRLKTIAISRQQGSGGAYVGHLVAERLGLRYIDRELLRHAAEYLNARREPEPDRAAAPSWFERLAQTFAAGGVDVGYVPPPTEAIYEGEIFETERRLMLEIAEARESVLVGRGAAQALRGQPGVVTVFLHAPDAWRAERLQRIYKMADRHDAERLLRDSDRERARFLKALNGCDWTDARNYDLATDTSTVGFDGAVEAIVSACGAAV